MPFAYKAKANYKHMSQLHAQPIWQVQCCLRVIIVAKIKLYALSTRLHIILIFKISFNKLCDNAFDNMRFYSLNSKFILFCRDVSLNRSDDDSLSDCFVYTHIDIPRIKALSCLYSLFY